MRTLLFILFICCAGIVPAQLPASTGSLIHVSDSTALWQDLRSVTQVLLQPATNEEVLAGKYDRSFRSMEQITAKEQETTSYWLKFVVKSLHDTRGWQLLLKSMKDHNGTGSAHDSVQVYFLTGNRQLISHQQTGILVPRSKKNIRGDAGLTAVEFSAVPGIPLLVYIKVNDGYAINSLVSHPVIRHPSVKAGEDENTTMLWMLFAIALVFSVLSFFFYFFVRERSYLLFGFYAFTLSQHYLILQPGYNFINWYIPEYPGIVIPAWTFLTMGGFILFCYFGRTFINLPALNRKTGKWYGHYLLCSIFILAIEIGWDIFVKQPFPLPWLNLVVIAIAFCFFIRFAFFKNILARLYVAGAAWLMLFTMAGLLWVKGIVKLPFNPWPVAQVGQFLIFGIGLAYKIRLNEKARAAAARITEMDNLKSKFFANISHEFRTPLTLIQGPLQQALEHSTVGKDGHIQVPLRQLQTMRRNTDRLLELVNQLLDLSRLDAGNMKLQLIRGDVLQFLYALAASFESMAERRQVHYHIHFPQQTAIVFFDKDKLEKIFTNLLANAFKYTPIQGTISVIVENSDDRLRFSIEDNGPGIPKKELDKVFDRFYQVENTGDNGSGIGLALVKELVDLYKGQVSVSSEPGKGSRFRVSLPVNKLSFNENDIIYGEWQQNRSVPVIDYHEESMERAAAKTTQSLPLLLLVEDNAELLRFIQETLEQQYQVITAVNGQQGLEKAFNEIPDIIISDVMMPLMDGFEMTAKLKQDERTSHIPVILLTAKAGQQHKIEGLNTGADDYLAKPFDAKELIARAANLVQQRRLLQQKFATSILLKPSEVIAASVDEQFLGNVMRSIEENMEEESFGVEELSRSVAMSRSQLHRKLTALIGRPPSELLRQTRLLRAKELLQKKAFSPSEVTHRVGFSSHTYFSKCFKEEFGMSPGEV